EKGHCACEKKSRCKEAGKHPLTSNGLKAATTDVKKIDKWWLNVTSANVAIATGTASGFWVLDADGEAGIQAIADLEKKYGTLPKTPTAQTGGGGRHYYFAWPKGASVANTTKLCELSLDVRGAGGYVLTPPSAHKSGESYTWHVSPEEVPLAPAPDWLLQL